VEARSSWIPSGDRRSLPGTQAWSIAPAFALRFEARERPHNRGDVGGDRVEAPSWKIWTRLSDDCNSYVNATDKLHTDKILTTIALTMLNSEDAARRDMGSSPFEEVGQRPRGSLMNTSSLSTLPRFAAAGVFVGAMALSSPSQAAAVDLLFEFRLDGMSTGTCAGIACPTPLGTVTVTGDTTGSLDFSVALAPDVNFSAGDSFWFDLSAGGNTITFALEAPTSGWVTPFSTGSFTPAPGADFPGPYADLVRCTAAGNICGTELNFTASGADATDPFVIAAPPAVVPPVAPPAPTTPAPQSHQPLKSPQFHRAG